MSWKLGKSSNKSPKTPARSVLAADELPGLPARSTTPTPASVRSEHGRSGLLTIGVKAAEGLELPSGTQVPAAVQAALSSAEARIAASVSPSSVTQQRLARKSHRESMQRVQCWWLPYLVMEFEVNQVLITPVGGQLSSPVYMYQTHL